MPYDPNRNLYTPDFGVQSPDWIPMDDEEDPSAIGQSVGMAGNAFKQRLLRPKQPGGLSDTIKAPMPGKSLEGLKDGMPSPTGGGGFKSL